MTRNSLRSGYVYMLHVLSELIVVKIFNLLSIYISLIDFE